MSIIVNFKVFFGLTQGKKELLTKLDEATTVRHESFHLGEGITHKMLEWDWHDPDFHCHSNP